MTNFSNLGLSDSILKALPELGIENPTEIQQKAIPFLVEEPSDFIGLAQTGTGKTAAFGLPLLQNIDESAKHVQALILAPTRELCQQIENQLSLYAKYLPKIRSTAVFGGANIVGQMKALKKVNQIVVATPGRLIDLANRKAIKLDQIEYLVLDEADEMLNMGFKEDLDKILSFTPEFKTTWLFSATMPNEIKRIVKEYMDSPKEIKVAGGNAVNTNISHQYVVVKSSDKKEAIKRFADVEADMKGIIFTRTKIEAQRLSDDLSKDGYGVEALHGDLSQSQRDRVMIKFKEHGLKLLVATDVAARGIDVNNLTHVFHHSIPDQREYYTHRSGRTARGGKKGISLAVITKGDVRKVGYLEKDLKISFEKVMVPSTNDVQARRMSSWLDKIPKKGEVKEIEDENLSAITDQLKKYTKDELISLLLEDQLKKLNLSGSRNDINDKPGERGERRDGFGGRPDSGNRYFINVGKMDGASNSDLIDFLSEESGLKKDDFSNIVMNDSHSYFDVTAEKVKSIDDNFEGLEIEGRDIRVNRDSGGSGGGKKRRRGGDGFSGRSGSGRRSGGGNYNRRGGSSSGGRRDSKGGGKNRRPRR